MIAEVLSVGTELLLGQIVDTDAAYLARRLSSLGVSVYHRATVGDNFERGVAALRLALSRADAVFLIGGLGPTQDDLTRSLIATACEAPLSRDPALVAHLRAWFGRRGHTPRAEIFLQADVPKDAVPVPNAVGTAPGLWWERGGKLVVALPGPPNEFEPMVDTEIEPRLREKLHLGGFRQVIRSRTLRIVGVGEPEAEARVKDLMQGANPTVAPYAKLAEVHLRVTAKAQSDEAAEALIAPVAAEIRARLGDAVYGEGEATLEEAVVDALRERAKTVATAESCTGGLLAGRLTNVAGSSEVFGTGVVAYANETKVHLLQIPQALVAAKGAVSPEVARAMAERVHALAGADYGIGITGIAGPGGGTAEKPVGLVYIAVVGAETRVEKCLFSGSRADIRYRATQTALNLLRKALLSL